MQGEAAAKKGAGGRHESVWSGVGRAVKADTRREHAHGRGKWASWMRNGSRRRRRSLADERSGNIDGERADRCIVAEHAERCSTVGAERAERFSEIIASATDELRSKKQ